jgi:hypothetical protein
MNLDEKGVRMTARGVAIALLAILGGCTTSKEMYLHDGSRGYNISCDGVANSAENCFQKAGELCGSKGYEITNPQGSVAYTRSMFIRCKP